MKAGRTAGALAAATALAVSACAPLAPQLEAPPAVRTAADAFELHGRLSASDGQQAASGTVDWQHEHGSNNWTLASPLGQILARLDSDARGAQLRTADGQHFSAASADELLPRVLGIEIPVDRLAHWVQAAPAADAEVRTRDAAGRPALVIDRGWRIEYPAYADASPAAAPARIEVSRGDARLRLLIDAWTALP